MTNTLVQDLRSWIGFPKKELDILLENAADEIERLQERCVEFSANLTIAERQVTEARMELDRRSAELVTSRSVQRRVAAMRGDPAPEFGSSASLIVSAEEAKSPFAFCHWSKDFLVPYTDCHCDTCVAARAALSG